MVYFKSQQITEQKMVFMMLGVGYTKIISMIEAMANNTCVYLW